MSELHKWQPENSGAVRPGWKCGNPKCGAVRKETNHWFSVSIALSPVGSSEPPSFSMHQWTPASWADSVLKLRGFLCFPVCGESCATVALSIHMAEVVSRALQQKAEEVTR